MTGIKIKNVNGYWVARANAHFTVSAPTAHRVVEMLKSLSETEELEFSNV